MGNLGMKLFGLVVMVAAIGLGCYGLHFLVMDVFVDGLVTIINQIKAPETDAKTIALAILQVVVAYPAGQILVVACIGLFGWGCTILGAAGLPGRRSR